MQDRKRTMSRKLTAPFHPHNYSQIENLKARRLDSLKAQQKHSAVCNVCVGTGKWWWWELVDMTVEYSPTICVQHFMITLSPQR